MKYRSYASQVEQMVILLNISVTSDQSPDALVALIQQQMASPDLSADVSLQLMRLIYTRKLRACKQLVVLLELRREQVGVPDDAPEDLVDFIFNDDVHWDDVASVGTKSGKTVTYGNAI